MTHYLFDILLEYRHAESKSDLGMHRKLFSGLSAAACLCLFGAPAQAQQEEKVLNIYNWSDYIAPDTYRQLLKRKPVSKFITITLDNNEIPYAKLVAGKTGYDIVVPHLTGRVSKSKGIAG